MPDFDLSTLNGAELRSLLDSTRKRGQAAQAYRILQEMDARRTRERKSANGGSRTISVDLGDPLDRHDELLEDDIPPMPQPEPEFVPPKQDSFDAELASALQDRRPAPRSRPTKPAPKARKPKREREPSWDEAARPPREVRKRGWGPLAIAASIAFGIVVGAGIARETFLAPATPPAAVFPQAPMLQVDTAAVAPPTETMPAQAEVASADAPPIETTPPLDPAAAADASSASILAAAAEPATPKADVGKAEAAKEESADAVAIAASAPEPSDKACSGPPADRVICEDPHLQRLQKELRQAYADALEAHADRVTLRQRQLAWRDARNAVSDPAALAKLYQDRIRKLNAATAQARRERDRGGKDA